MRAPILTLAHDEILDPSIGSYVGNTTSPDATESIVREITLRPVEVIA